MICSWFPVQKRKGRQATAVGGRGEGSGSMIVCKKARQSRCDWADIGIDLLLQIYERLPPADILRCRGVCRSWRSVTKTYISHSLNSPPASREPLFLWPSDCLGRFLDVSRGSEGNFYVTNHETRDLLWLLGNCVGFSYGYFLFWGALKKKQLYLFHPRLFGGAPASVRFPPISMGRGKKYGLGIERAALWADPITATANCGVVVKFRQYRQLMFAKSGATKFSELECQDSERSSWLSEIICIDNRIYAINDKFYDHRMEAWDCSSSEDAPRKVMDFQPSFSSGFIPSRSRHITFHLVESRGGELLLVTIDRPTVQNYVYASGRYSVSSKSNPSCRVYKMDFKEKEWVHVDSLGDDALFVMKCHTMSLSVREFPQYQRNTVYFRHYFDWSHKTRLGIFSLEDGSLKEVHTKLLS